MPGGRRRADRVECRAASASRCRRNSAPWTPQCPLQISQARRCRRYRARARSPRAPSPSSPRLNPRTKVALSRAVAHAWNGGDLPMGGPSRRRARHGRRVPVCVSPRDMPKRRNFGSLSGRIALLHALAHIELNAIDLAWDLIARFGVARFGEAGCRARFSTIGSRSPPRRPSIFPFSWAGSRRLAPAMAICRRMTGCGRRRRRRRTIFSRGSRSCRWCSKRAVSTSRPEMIGAPRTRRRPRQRRNPRPHLSRRDRPCRGRPALVRVAVRAAGARTAADVSRAGAPPFHRRAEAAVQPSGAREAGFPAAYYETLACAGARC